MHKKTRNLLIHGVISLAIYFIIANLPPVGSVTEMGMKILGLTLGLIYGLITIENRAIPSIAALILIGTSGYTNVMSAFMSGIGHYAVVMVLGLMMIGGICTHSGLARILAERIINSKIANGRPWVLTCLIMVAAMIPSMFLTAIPVLIIVWGIIINIFDLVGYTKGEKWPALMMCSATASSAIAISAMPFSMGVSTDFSIFRDLMGGDISIPAIPFILSSFALCAGFLVLQMLALRFVFRPDTSKLKNYKAPEHREPFTTDHKRALVLLIIFIVVVLAPDILPKGSALQVFMSGFGSIGAAFLVVLLAIIIPNKDGTPFITLEQIMNKGAFWSLLAMIAALMVVCGSLTVPELGISTWLADLIRPTVQSLGGFGTYVLMMIIGLVGTNFLDNSVVCITMAAVLSVVSQDLAIPAVGVYCMLMHAGEYGILTPASSPLGALTYAQIEGGWLNKKTILSSGVVYMLLLFIVLLVIGYPLIGFHK